jgi:hypothetical protein
MFPVSTPNFLPTFPTVLNRGSLNYRFNTSFPAGQIIKQNLAIDLIGNDIVSYARGGNWRSMGTLTSIAVPNATVVNSNNLGGVTIFNGLNSGFIGTTFQPRLYTITAWIKGTGPGSGNDAAWGTVIASNSLAGATGYMLRYQWGISAIQFIQDGSNQAIQSLNNSAPRNTILSVTIRLDGQTRQIYINGLLAASSAYTFAPPYPSSGDTSYKIGYWGQAGFQSFFNGEIYRVSMYDRALSDSEILQNYTSQRGFYGV